LDHTGWNLADCSETAAASAFIPFPRSLREWRDCDLVIETLERVDRVRGAQSSVVPRSLRVSVSPHMQSMVLRLQRRPRLTLTYLRSAF
jgi:hypothetical protein